MPENSSQDVHRQRHRHKVGMNEAQKPSRRRRTARVFFGEPETIFLENEIDKMFVDLVVCGRKLASLSGE